MIKNDPGWDLYRSFLGVLNEGSLSGAARALGLTQPTVGRHIDALEATLGFALFTRSQQGFAPTEAALALRPYAETLSATAAALLRAASSHGGGVRGTVRITASEVIGIEVLPPILAALRGAYPELVVELALSNRLEDLLQREADIAIRMVRPTQQALVARRIGSVELGLHAHPDYLAQRGTPATLVDLKDHTLIGFDKENGFIRSLKPRLGPLTRQAFAFRTDSDLAQLAAIRAGFGIGVCQVPLAHGKPTLVRVLGDAIALELDTWLVLHEDLRDSPACKAVFTSLGEGLARYVASDPQTGS